MESQFLARSCEEGGRRERSRGRSPPPPWHRCRAGIGRHRPGEPIATPCNHYAYALFVHHPVPLRWHRSAFLGCKAGAKGMGGACEVVLTSGPTLHNSRSTPPPSSSDTLPSQSIAALPIRHERTTLQHSASTPPAPCKAPSHPPSFSSKFSTFARLRRRGLGLADSDSPGREETLPSGISPEHFTAPKILNSSRAHAFLNIVSVGENGWNCELFYLFQLTTGETSDILCAMRAATRKTPLALSRSANNETSPHTPVFS